MPKISHKFQENEKVLCYHGPLLYEAKVQKSQENKESKDSKEKTVQYLVHYLGWSKNWDEWVPEDRVCKIDETSLQKQKELKDAQNKSNKNKSAKKKSFDGKEPLTPIATPGSDRPKAKVSSIANVNVVSPLSLELKDSSNLIKDIDGQRKKRIKVETSVESADPTVAKNSIISIEIPSLLKQSLVDDWQQINQKKLVRLPSKVCVNRIVDDYLKLRLKDQKLSLSKESAIKEAAEGIKEFFNASIATKLLYPFEKNQFKDLIKDPEEEPKPSVIFGGIHLLRLFVKLGELFSYLNLDEKSLILITDQIHHFLKYLEQNPSLFTSNEYELASNDYLKKCS